LEAERFPEAAFLLAAVHPDQSAQAWERHLQRLAGNDGLVLGLAEGPYLQAVTAVARTGYAWCGAWLDVARVTGPAAVPGPQAAARTKALLVAAEEWSRQQGCAAMLAEPAPWTAAAGFMPQSGVPSWLVTPEQLRRYRQAKPMRPISPADVPALDALYQRRALSLGGSSPRHPLAWSDMLNDMTPAGPLYGFIATSGSAYVILQGGHPTANQMTVPVLEWADEDPVGFASVITFLAQWQGRVSLLTLPVPPDRPPAAILAGSQPVQAQLWFGPALRVIAPETVVARALPAARFLPHEDGIRLQLPEGELTIPAATLSALVGGGVDPHSAYYLGDIQGDAAACEAFVRDWPAPSGFRFPVPGRRYP
jgi:hypothetical protein